MGRAATVVTPPLRVRLLGVGYLLLPFALAVVVAALVALAVR